MLIRAGIDSSGYRTAVRDYTEPAVVEELAANSYDADATTCLVLLDTSKGQLHVVDNGLGFPQDAIERIAILGAGSKQNIPYSSGKRHYLGSYGYGLKSSLNIATKVTVRSVSDEGEFFGVLDWAKLDEALRPEFPGFDFQQKPSKKGEHGTHLILSLKNPTSKDQLTIFATHLANLPTDGGAFKCYVGLYADAVHKNASLLSKFGQIPHNARALLKKHQLVLAESSRQADLDNCERHETHDKEDKTVKGTIFFGGIKHGEIQKLKPGLRGIYVRIHGRILKQSFTESKYTYNISRWKKFESGLRVELNIDWLRDQISLSREGIRFANPKLEEEFKGVLSRCVSGFINPQLKKLEQKDARIAARKSEQRFELARKRIKRDKSIMVRGLSDGFPYRPETDGELVLILSQAGVLKQLNPAFSVVDYNDKAGFDCVLYDKSKRSFINTELEPTLMEWLDHKETDDVELIITYTLGKWRTGAKKKGAGGSYRLVNEDGSKAGHYKLLEYSSAKSKNPKKDYPVMVLDEILK